MVYICMTFNVFLSSRVFAQNKEFGWTHRSTTLIRTEGRRRPGMAWLLKIYGRRNERNALSVVLHL